MKASLLVYFASITEGLATFFGTTAVALFFICFAGIFGCAMTSSCATEYDAKRRGLTLQEFKASMNKRIKRFLYIPPLAFFFVLLLTLLPSEKQAYLIAGAYIGQKVLVESELSKDLQDIVGLKVKEYKKELQYAVDNKTQTQVAGKP